MNKKLFITSTLPYVNSSPHVGFLFEAVIADALTRYFKIKLGKENVFFNTGLDEEGLKIWEKAQELNIPVEVFLEQQSIIWKDFCLKAQIDYDNFYRTSTTEHQENVQKFWNECLKKGDIYKKNYSGKYCIGCEAFKFDKELIDGKCQDHPGIELNITNEENYFFRLSNYRNHLSEWFNNSPEFLLPKNRLEELRNFINDAEDISVSRLRTNVPWGTEVPNDKEHTIYIWFSALTNYIFSCKYYENREEFNGWWQDTVQICGPDNLKFQAAIFQAMLASAEIGNTKKLLVHGMILDKNGRKMSKTAGNVVDPIEQINKYGISAVRYYALAGLQTYGNSKWDEEQLVNIYNAHLADNYGNLLTRVVHLCALKNIVIDTISENNRNFLRTQIDGAVELFETYDISGSLSAINDVISQANKYITDKQPWGKNSTDYKDVLESLFWVLYEVTLLYLPIIPDKAKQALNSLETMTKDIVFPKIELKK